jgi:sporulation protein YlmC with PRC-barrel domain
MSLNTPAHNRGIAVLLAGAMTLAAVPGLGVPPNIPNPQAVKAKVEKLGVGEHVMVQLTEGPKLHGHIIGIEQHAFKLQPDREKAEVQIPYDHVIKVKKNPGAITWMLVGAVLVVIVIVAATK